MNAQTEIEHIRKGCIEAILASGVQPPTIFVIGDKGVAMEVLDFLPETTALKSEKLFKSGFDIGFRNEVGNLTAVAFATEGWMISQRTTDEDTGEVLPPSESPDRVEVVLITTKTYEGNANDIFMYEMLRDGNGDLIDLSGDAHQIHSVKSPLIDALAAGVAVATKFANGTLDSLDKPNLFTPD